MVKPLFSLDFGNTPALIDGDSGNILSYKHLQMYCEQIRSLIDTEKALVFLWSSNRIDEVIAYLGLVNAGHAVCLLDAHMHKSFKQQLVELYRPHFIVEHHAIADLWIGYDKVHVSSSWHMPAIHKSQTLSNSPALYPHLQLLLTTSGTTGSPKLIRLTRENILSNASSIAQYLQLQPHERAIASLPIHYSYGLSVLHSHILVGASITLSSSTPAQLPFWQTFKNHACTSFAGVPYTYTLLDKIGFDRIDIPSLRTLTQAGGRMDTSLTVKYHAMMTSRNGYFFSMYGQTEATARIAYLPPTLLPEKAGAIGIAIPRGSLYIATAKDSSFSQDKKIGELVYQGPNVMLGYASTADDLQLADTMKGILPTGDMGYCDADGIFFVTGRLKRIAKIYGLRLNLDDIEQALSCYGSIAITATDSQLCIYIENGVPQTSEQCAWHLTEFYHLHPTAFKCHLVPLLPRTAAGKIDYPKL
jgi:long-chain acyl-CoA synthetase